MTRPLLLLTCVASLAAAQTAATRDENRQKMEQRLDHLKKRSQGEARSTSTLGCKDLLEQTRLACGEAFTLGLEVNCQQLTTALKLSVEQARGQLFETGDASKDVQAANAACRVHLGSIERARKKSDGKLPDAAAAPADCAELAKVMDAECFAPFAQTGTFKPVCQTLFQLTSQARAPAMPKGGGAGPNPADRCKGPMFSYRMTVKMSQ
jgi:hypothetical protein